MTNPILANEDKLILPLRYLVQSYAKHDGPTLPSLAVPIELINYIVRTFNANIAQIRTAQLVAVAFYFLLRVGEYTKPKRKTRTVQFRLKDVVFWKNKRKIDHKTASLKSLLACDGVTLRIENQKNGVKNQTIFHEANNECSCPVKMLAKIVNNIRKHSSDPNTMLCAYKNGNGMGHVASRDISKTLKDAAKATDMQQRGFPISRICPHSLRAGGAMALKLANMDIVMIKKYGRWSSDTFLTYIHEQISSLGHGVSKAMAQPRDFFNIAGYEI